MFFAFLFIWSTNLFCKVYNSIGLKHFSLDPVITFTNVLVLRFHSVRFGWLFMVTDLFSLTLDCISILSILKQKVLNNDN